MGRPADRRGLQCGDTDSTGSSRRRQEASLPGTSAAAGGHADAGGASVRPSMGRHGAADGEAEGRDGETAESEAVRRRRDCLASLLQVGGSEASH